MQGQTTLDGWVVTPCRTTPLRDCADAADACAVAGLYAELPAFVCTFGHSPPAQSRTYRRITRCCACTVGGFIWWGPRRRWDAAHWPFTSLFPALKRRLHTGATAKFCN
eukprot:237433-Chlamydomonas_euryale.AAC.1